MHGRCDKLCQEELCIFFHVNIIPWKVEGTRSRRDSAGVVVVTYSRPARQGLLKYRPQKGEGRAPAVHAGVKRHNEAYEVTAPVARGRFCSQ